MTFVHSYVVCTIMCCINTHVAFVQPCVVYSHVLYTLYTHVEYVQHVLYVDSCDIYTVICCVYSHVFYVHSCSTCTVTCCAYSHVTCVQSCVVYQSCVVCILMWHIYSHGLCVHLLQRQTVLPIYIRK